MSVIFNLFANKIAKNMKKNDISRQDVIIDETQINKSIFKYGKRKNEEFILYRLKSGTKNGKLIIDIHGGAWIYGDAHLNEKHNEWFCLNGYDVISIGYPLLQKVRLYEMVKAILRALKMIEENSKDLKISLDNVLLIGDSACGHLAMLIYAILNNKKFKEIYDAPDINLNIKMLYLEHPCAYLDNLLEGADGYAKFFLNLAFFGIKLKRNPIYRFSSANDILNLLDLPYTLIVTSTNDEFKYLSDRLNEDILKKNSKYEFVVVDGEKHVFEVMNPLKESSINVNKKCLEIFENIC